MPVTVVGAVGTLTAKASPSALAFAKTVGLSVTGTVVGALHRTPFNVTLCSGVHTFLTDTHAV
jgi:hypothetical protein